MSPRQIDRYRVPAALVLILIAGFVFWPRGGVAPTSAAPSPSVGVTAGEPGGEALPTMPSTPAAPIPTATQAATPTPTPTAAPPPSDGFAAEVLACRSISGSTCRDQLGTLPPGAGSFTALILFSNASAGDLLNAVLDGPSGTIAGTPYALQGGGDGYFWAQFQIGGLPGGEYVLTATRNGQGVATTAFRMAGG